MNELSIGATTYITGYLAHNAFTERLRELGLVAGTKVRIIRKAPFNGPIEIQYGHSQLVLRADEIALVGISN